MSLKQVLSILWRRLWLVVLGVVATAIGAAVIVMIVPPRYDATASVSVDLGRNDPVTGVAIYANGGRGAIPGLVALIESQRISAEVVRRLNLTNDPQFAQEYQASGLSGQVGAAEWIANAISKNVDGRSIEGSSVIQIVYKGTTPVQAALLANTYLAAFQDAVVEMKATVAQQTSAWFEPQLDKLRAALDEARQRLNQYQQSAKLLAPNAGNDSDASPLNATSGDLSSSKQQLLALQSQIAAIDSGQSNAQASLLDTPALASLKLALSSVNADLGRARTALGSNNPKVQALLASQKSLQDQIAAELVNARASAAAKIKALQDQITALQSNYTDQYGKMISIQAQRERLATLQREVSFRQDQLETASRSAASAKMQGELSFSNVTTLDNATPPEKAAFPNFPLLSALALGSGLALGIIFALITEALDRRIRVVSDLNFATEAPLLGTIAKSKMKTVRRARDKGFSLTLPAAQQ